MGFLGIKKEEADFPKELMLKSLKKCNAGISLKFLEQRQGESN